MQRGPRLTMVNPDAVDAAGSPEEQVFRAYSAYVAFIGVRILGRDDDVDDLVQDVFEAAFGDKGLLRLPRQEPGLIRGWLSTTTVRMAARRLRRRRLLRRLGLAGTDDHKAAPPLAGGTPEEAALAARLYAWLDDVPIKHRVAWTMHKIEDETLPAIAASLGCSVATVKRWIVTTQAFLETRLGRERAP